MLMLSFNQFIPHSLSFLFIVIASRVQKVREEKQFKDEKHDKKFYQDYRPKSFADGHFSESIAIKAPNIRTGG